MKQNLFSFNFSRLFKTGFKKAIYSLSILFILCANTNAQIIYNDIADCTTTIIANDSQMQLCSIDFNNDGQRDYSVRWDDFGNNNWFIHLVPQNFFSDAVAVKATSNSFQVSYAKSFSLNQTIGSSENWDGSEPLIGDNEDGNFLNLGDKYLGVKFTKNGSVYYGWVLVNFSQTGNTRSLTVKSHAYNSSAGQSILAGQTTNLGVNESNLSEKFKIYPNPVKTSFTVENNIKNGDISFEVFNALGQLVKKGIMNNKNEINVSELNEGIYYIKLYNNKNIVGQQKFIKS